MMGGLTKLFKSDNFINNNFFFRSSRISKADSETVICQSNGRISRQTKITYFACMIRMLSCRTLESIGPSAGCVANLIGTSAFWQMIEIAVVFTDGVTSGFYNTP